MMASVHSRLEDFFNSFLWVSLNSLLADGPKYFVSLSLPHFGKYINGSKTPAACSRNENFPKDFKKSMVMPIKNRILIMGRSTNMIHHKGLPLSFIIT